MSHSLLLPAIDGRDPLGFLAALGLLRILTEEIDAHTALSFSATTAQANLHSSYTTTSQVADALIAIIARTPAECVIPDLPSTYPLAKTGTTGTDPMRSPRTHHRATVARVHTVGGDAAVRWHTSLVTDLGRDNKERVALTQYTAPVGQQTVRSFFEKTTTLIRSDPNYLREALTRWQRVPGFTGEYLDHRVLRSAADHPLGESSEIGVPGATWLAIMALPMLRLTGDGTTITTTLWRRPPRQPATMIWPLWRQPLNLPAAIALIEHPAIDILPDDGPTNGRNPTVRVTNTAWQALGIFTVAAARRQPIEGRKSAGVLTPTPVITTP